MNEREKNASIAYILSQSPLKPRPARARAAGMLRAIGLRYIFWDTGYSLFFAAVTLAAVTALFLAAPGEYRYSAAVAVAPLLFLLTSAFAETSERADGLYELKQTCRYTIRQIAALRVLCYSVAGAAFTAVVAAAGAKDGYEFISLFPLCLSALFACAALSLAAMRFLRGKWGGAAFLAAWAFVSAALPFSLGERWETLLGGTPAAISAVIAVTGAAALAVQLSKMLSEADKYAAA
ncbi:MAG: hypothetical protein LBH95_09055 [Oscillospiraceae bacterium]|jgi:hypothetical protein|nr:hypothetical protein [Oscillospiraceae bacterium]